MNNIVLSTDVKEPTQLFDVVVSNEKFIKKALGNNLLLTDLHQDSIIAYYLDHFDEIVAISGFKAFFFKTRNSKAIKEYVKKGLEKLKLEKHLDLFKQYLDKIAQFDNVDIYEIEGKLDISFSDLDIEYRSLEDELLENELSNFLFKHKDTVFLSDEQQDEYILNKIKLFNIKEMKERENEYNNALPGYIKDINYICNVINKQLEKVTDARINMFDFNNQLYIDFLTTDNQKLSYIDLGLELVLLNENDEEVRRFSKKVVGE